MDIIKHYLSQISSLDGNKTFVWAARDNGHRSHPISERETTNQMAIEISQTIWLRGKVKVECRVSCLIKTNFQAGLFSFEAGRKTPTGPGVYAFKCRRAEKLFNLLQVRVREQGPDRSSVSLSALPSLASGLTGDTGPVSPGLGLETEPGSPSGSFSFGETLVSSRDERRRNYVMLCCRTPPASLQPTLTVILAPVQSTL